MRTLIRNVRIVDAGQDRKADVLIDGERIAAVLAAGSARAEAADRVLNPRSDEILMPAFVELHAHFRDPGYPEKETLESACLSAAAGGYGTSACMANTKPVLDDPTAAAALKARSDALGLIDLYPVLSLTRGMAGADLSGLDALAAAPEAQRAAVRLLSEDGKDVADDGILRGAFIKAAALGLPVSCHCDAGGPEAAAAKAAGEPRAVWSRIEEDVATVRALELAAECGARAHIAHASTAAALEAVRAAKKKAGPRGKVTCEVAPHHFCLTEADAEALGGESRGRVNPPLRAEEDRLAVVAAVLDGTADAIATDHAPHAEADKAAGAPGFTGFETAFAASRTALVGPEGIDLKRLSALLSAGPARILGLEDRGRIEAGLRADLVLAAPDEEWTAKASEMKSRGKNTPFEGRVLRGRVRMTLRGGRVVYERGE